MIKSKSLIVFLSVIFCYSLLMGNQSIYLKTKKMDDVIGITTFLMNSNGEIFLFSSRMSKIFKFKPDGTFDISFCRKGEGPGEITRVFYMFHNPLNDYLYLPEYYSMAKGKITIYDRNGKYKGLLEPEIPKEYKDRIVNLIFLKNGNYIIETKKRVGWKPIGKLFKTQDEVWIRHFNKDGKFLSEIYKTEMDDELSNAVRWGGPQILFKPSLIVKLTTNDYIGIAKTDENNITIYDKDGKKVKIIKVGIEREKLSDQEFNKEKKLLIEGMKRYDSRMLDLARKMIKLEYKPIYFNVFFISDNIVLSKVQEENKMGYIKKTKLLFFDWKGKIKGDKIIEGYVTKVKEDRIFIIDYDADSNESFRIEPFIFSDKANKEVKTINK